MTSFEERKKTIELVKEAVKSGARKSISCEIIGLPIRTIQRWENTECGDRRSFTKNIPANKITQRERDEIISISCSDNYKDLSPNEIVPALAERGRYIASESTFYRVLREERMLTHRSDSNLRQNRNKPEELKATGPDQVLSWDITYLLTNIKGKYYYLYMFEDIWSRAIRGWNIYDNESSNNASNVISKICKKNNIANANVKLHSDNGSPMKGAVMLSTLQRLGVMPSFSRPSVSNDNPYSESLFKTLKYKAGYPKSFSSIEEAKKWVANFVNWYNNQHRHSGIKFVTPMQRHTGEDKIILKRRNETYKKAQKKNPKRWSCNTRNWDHIGEVFLNPNSIQDSLKKVS